MNGTRIAVLIGLLLSCRGSEKPAVLLENLHRILVDENGIEIVTPTVDADSIRFTARLAQPAIDSWRKVERVLNHQPVLTWVTVTMKITKDGEDISRHQFRLNQLQSLGPDNTTVRVALPRQLPKSHEPRRPPPPEGSELQCRIWAVKLD